MRRIRAKQVRRSLPLLQRFIRDLDLAPLPEKRSSAHDRFHWTCCTAPCEGHGKTCEEERTQGISEGQVQGPEPSQLGGIQAEIPYCLEWPGDGLATGEGLAHPFLEDGNLSCTMSTSFAVRCGVKLGRLIGG